MYEINKKYYWPVQGVPYDTFLSLSPVNDEEGLIVVGIGHGHRFARDRRLATGDWRPVSGSSLETVKRTTTTTRPLPKQPLARVRRVVRNNRGI